MHAIAHVILVCSSTILGGGWMLLLGNYGPRLLVSHASPNVWLGQLLAPIGLAYGAAVGVIIVRHWRRERRISTQEWVQLACWVAASFLVFSLFSIGGYFAGLYIPLFLTPHDSQGPLLAYLIAPVGSILGAIISIVGLWWLAPGRVKRGGIALQKILVSRRRHR